MLKLAGDRKPGDALQNGRYLRSERIFGRFERSFSMPLSVDSDATRAVFKDGVLQISVPKSGVASARTVDIE